MRKLMNGIRLKTLIIAVLIAALSQGCYPWCARSDRSTAYHGRLLDAETGLPVEKAELKICLDSLQASTKSSWNGYFRLGPLKQFHVGIMTLEGIRPELKPLSTNRLFLNISRHDYQPVQLNVPSDPSIWNSSWKTSGHWNGDLELGDILLKPEHRKGN